MLFVFACSKIWYTQLLLLLLSFLNIAASIIVIKLCQVIWVPFEPRNFMGVDNLLCCIYGVKQGAKRTANVICAESETSLTVQLAAWCDHVGLLGLHIHFSRVEYESLCRFTTKDHHLILIELNCGHRWSSYEVWIIDLNVTPVLFCQGVSVLPTCRVSIKITWSTTV